VEPASESIMFDNPPPVEYIFAIAPSRSGAARANRPGRLAAADVPSQRGRQWLG
jgi:hypothetical protein